MAIVLFILIAGLWAAFLLPSFFDHRNNAPRSTTRAFAQTRSKLARVSSSQPDGEAYVRRYTQKRRRQILVGLAITSLATLIFATWSGSIPWLWVNIGVDVAIASYVTVLLTIKQQRLVPRAQVVQIPAQPQPALHAVPDAPPVEESRTVRIIAG